MNEKDAGANAGWKPALTDPVREDLRSQGRQPDMDHIRGLFPPTTGEPAFDPVLINGNIGRLKTVPEVRTGHQYLDHSIKVGLAHIDATFQGDHPKYGVRNYAQNYNDGFPPTIIAAVDALSSWGLDDRAARLFRYWLANFVRSDGTIRYGGTSLAEMGQLLHTAALLHERAGTRQWWRSGRAALDRIAELLLGMRREAENEDGLLTGVPEDDEKGKIRKYFHNNAWVAKGLQRYADLCERVGATPATPAGLIRKAARALAKDTLAAIRRCWPEDAADWWLPPQVESLDRPQNLTGTREASYTNYRYWPELLSSGVLPEDVARRVIRSRLTAGGQFCGTTRFADWLDDWPLTNYLYALWALGEKWDFLLTLFGHVAYHQAEGHLTAYEQLSFPPGREIAAYCLPCQLVAARAGRLLVSG